MEPITHFLTGACLARTGFNRKTALATATMTLAAEAGDLDAVGSFKNPVFGFAHHRGFTHSFLGIPLVAAFVVGFLYLIWRWRGKTTNKLGLPPRWGLLFWLACLAGLTHILLDFTNNYGVRPYWPFWEKWYSWDIVFIVEPVILAFLIAGLALPPLFRLVSEEVGARKRGPHGRLAAALALIGVIAVWAVRDYEHRRAVNALKARTYEGAEPLRASAYPYWVNPFRWHGVVETQNFLATAPVNSAIPEVDPQNEMRVQYKSPESAATLAAKKSYLGQVYLDWAHYPIVQAERLEDTGGYVVTFRDLRYTYPEMKARNTLSASEVLDSNLNVVSVTFGTRTIKGSGR